MSRRLIVTRKQIYERRASAWADHYRNRQMARTLLDNGWDGVQITMALSQAFPAPELGIDAWLLDIPLNLRREHSDQILSRFRLTPNHRDLLCRWYWSAPAWEGEFVPAFQSLPEVYEDYYMLYEPEPVDRYVLVPMSGKPKQGTSGAEKVQVPYFVRSGCR